MKPGKVRIVFDCAAKYHGISLNQQFLQGPDFTNPLVEVLTRFRQETAIAADIKGMFRQVYVDPKDFDVFRLLWWPDGQLNEQPQEYRMVRRLMLRPRQVLLTSVLRRLHRFMGQNLILK